MAIIKIIVQEILLEGQVIHHYSLQKYYPHLETLFSVEGLTWHMAQFD